MSIKVPASPSWSTLNAAARDDVIEICVNPDGTCWGEFQGDHFMRPLDQSLSETEVKDLGNQIASSANTTMSKDRPIVSVSITYRDRPIRAQVITPPAVSSAMSISLRFFSSLPLDGIKLGFLYGKERKLEELRLEKTRQLREVVSSGNIDNALAFCVENKLNMIVSGGTSTGKTVAARKILSHVRPDERIVTIEEASELVPEQPNAVTLIANRDAEFQSADVLLTATLRMRPDRIILGEVRGKEAMTFLEAINTGHGGSMTTTSRGNPATGGAALGNRSPQNRNPNDLCGHGPIHRKFHRRDYSSRSSRRQTRHHRILPIMKTFEYEILSFPMDRKNGLIDMQAALNAKGQIGWEVVSISSSEFANIGHTAFLKREAAEGDDVGGAR